MLIYFSLISICLKSTVERSSIHKMPAMARAGSGQAQSLGLHLGFPWGSGQGPTSTGHMSRIAGLEVEQPGLKAACNGTLALQLAT